MLLYAKGTNYKAFAVPSDVREVLKFSENPHERNFGGHDAQFETIYLDNHLHGQAVFIVMIGLNFVF
ncbi:hypothetical protein N7475_002202 [Penicillium sp. IBT 31633x]|nr:hypothetical protein N7475_002202 [Penicillium sp. IBT 31633x]